MPAFDPFSMIGHNNWFILTVIALLLSILSFNMKNVNKKCLFSNTQVFYIMLTEHDLNRQQGLNIQ